jgi:NADPH:quinone reductase-like Zn-dependent oxidoreductase
LAGGPAASRATLLLDNARIGVEACCKRLRPVHEEAVRLAGSGEIDPGVTGVYPLERAAGAHRVFENRAASGKLILAI